MVLFFRADLTTIATYRYDAALANQARQSPKEETQHASHSHSEHPFRRDARDRSRLAAAGLAAGHRPAWQTRILRIVEGHGVLHRGGVVQARAGILPGRAEAADRADPERRLQHLRSRGGARGRGADLQQWRR